MNCYTCDRHAVMCACSTQEHKNVFTANNKPRERRVNISSGEDAFVGDTPPHDVWQEEYDNQRTKVLA